MRTERFNSSINTYVADVCPSLMDGRSSGDEVEVRTRGGRGKERGGRGVKREGIEGEEERKKERTEGEEGE